MPYAEVVLRPPKVTMTMLPIGIVATCPNCGETHDSRTVEVRFPTKHTVMVPIVCYECKKEGHRFTVRIKIDVAVEVVDG
jgi:RNase P subunit RPR2